MNASQLAINSISTSGTFEERLSAYAGAGFRQVEFFLGHVKEYLAAGHTTDDAARLLDRSGLRCIGGFETELQAFSPAERRSANHAAVIANARLLADLGGSMLVVGTDGPAEGSDDPIGMLAETFAGVAAQVADHGITLCIEFNWSPIVKSLRTAVDVARRSGARNVGVLFDPAHYHCTPSKLEQIDAEAVRSIRHVHVNDMRDKPGELSDCNADRVLPGRGCLNLREIFGRIEQQGYAGSFSIEMFDPDLRAMPAAKAAKTLYESLLGLLEIPCGSQQPHDPS